MLVFDRLPKYRFWIWSLLFAFVVVNILNETNEMKVPKKFFEGQDILARVFFFLGQYHGDSVLRIFYEVVLVVMEYE